MTTFYIDQQGAAGTGTSASDTRTTIPSYSNGDSLLFKYGSTFAFTSQLSITATGTTWGAFGDSTLGRPIWSSTAANFGSINVSTASGVTTFQDIEFRNYLSGSSNGGVVNCAINGTSGIASSLKVERCKVLSCAWNAFRFAGTSQATAALTGEFNDVEWDDIGEDCIYGWVITLDIRRPQATRISTRTATGDFLGMINGYAATVTVTGPGVIDHSDVDCKQCFIVDASGGTPAGLLSVSGLTITGYGSASVAPTAHTVVICDIPLAFNHNEVFTYGSTIGTSNSGDNISNNVFNVGNIGSSNSMIAMSANGGTVSSNTIRSMNALPSTARMVVVANGVTSATIENNFFSGVAIAIKSDSVGYTPTARNNAYYDVDFPRLDSSGVAFDGTDEVIAQKGLRADYMPHDAAVWTAGIAGTGTDFSGTTRVSPTTIGAIQYLVTLVHHVRRQLREAVAAAITGLTTTGSDVFQSRVYPVQESELPALLVYVTEEEVVLSELSDPAVYQRDFTITVTGQAKAAADLDDTLDFIGMEVEIALSSGVSVGGVTIDLDLTGSTISMSPDAEKPVGEIEMRYRATLFTAENTPNAVLNG